MMKAGRGGEIWGGVGGGDWVGAQKYLYTANWPLGNRRVRCCLMFDTGGAERKKADILTQVSRSYHLPSLLRLTLTALVSSRRGGGVSPSGRAPARETRERSAVLSGNSGDRLAAAHTHTQRMAEHAR